LVFQGTKTVKSLFDDNFVSDHLPTVLARIPANTAVFNVWAEEPDQKPLQIGQIIMTTTATSSKFGDEGLFFQHVRKEDDFALRPDWIPYATQLVDKQANTPYYN